MQNIDLEQRMRDAGVARARTIAARAADRGVISETPAGVAAIRNLIRPTTLKIAEWMVETEARTSGKRGRPPHLFRLCGGMDPEVLAYLTSKVAIDKAASGHSLTRLASAVGMAIEDELRLADFEAADPGLFGAIERTLRQRCSSPEHQRKVWNANAVKRGIEITRWTKNERVNVGLTLADLFIQASGLIETYLMPLGRNRWQYQTRLTAAARAWMEDRTDKAGLLRPMYLPTTQPPLPWADTIGGGYGLDKLVPMPLVKRTYRAHVEALQAADLSRVYRSLNAIQDTAWRVNTPVLDVMKEAWDRGLLTDILPAHDDRPLPPRPDAPPDSDELRAWNKAARDTYEFNAKSRAQRLEFARLLGLADELRDAPALHFPHQLDFRGRVYAVPAGLNPQGPDEARSLLTFTHGKPVDGSAFWWLNVHGANTFGFDKVSMSERAQWGQDNRARAASVVADPLGDLWWTEADKPWSFLAWCFEVCRTDGLSSLPIALDGTCNGLQHFSAMLRDPVGGAAVNLTPSSSPQDIYQRVADRTMELLRVRAAEDNHWMAHGWLAFGIDRKITKRPVMVLPYGGTRISCMDYVRQAVKERIAGGQENPFGDQLQAATTMLASVVWDAIGDVVVAARTAMQWLQSAARAATAAGLPCSWVTPSGFPAHQEYREVKGRQIKTRLRGGIIAPLDYGEVDRLDRSKQALGISPNFVHSMDAAALALTICGCLDEGITSFAMIHDSYGTVAADTDALARTLREEFVRMYEQHDVLAEFRDHLLAQRPTLELPPLPPKGSLDIALVRQSPYFFA